MNIPVIKNKIDFTDGAGTSGDENKRCEVWEWERGIVGIVVEETTGMGEFGENDVKI